MPEHHIAPWINSGWAMSSSRNLRPEAFEGRQVVFSDFNCFNCQCDLLVFDRGELERNGVNVLVETYVYIYIIYIPFKDQLNTHHIYISEEALLQRHAALGARCTTVTQPGQSGHGGQVYWRTHAALCEGQGGLQGAPYSSYGKHSMNFSFHGHEIPFIKNLKEFLGVIQNIFQIFAI